MDNAPIHSNVGLECAHHQCIHLPPYSPFLNPCEEAFSTWKADVKQELSIPFNVSRIGDHSAAAAAGVSLTTWRTAILKEIGESALHSNVSATNVSQWYNHPLTFFPKITNRLDL